MGNDNKQKDTSLSSQANASQTLANATQAGSRIQLASDLQSFFEDQIQRVSKKQGLKVSPFTTQYLGGLLARFSQTQNYFVIEKDEEGKSKLDYPRLALLYLESYQNPLAEQLFRFSHVGDIALFTSGFFGERITRSAVDMDYYVAMGGMAYERAGKIRESLAQERALNVYFELSEQFESFVEVLAELADQSMLINEKDVLKLYERWLQNGSQRLSRMLAEIGVLADHGDPSGGQS